MWREAVQTSVPLVFGDALGVSLGIGFGRLFVDVCGGGHPPGMGLVVGCLGLMVFVNTFLALYPGTALAPVDELRRGFIGTAMIYGAVVAWLAWHGAASMVDFVGVAIGAATTLVMFALLRPALRRLCAGRSWWGQSAIVYASGSAGQSLIEALREHPETGLVPIGAVDSRDQAERYASWSVRILDVKEHEGPDLFSGSSAIPNLLIVHPRWEMGRDLWSPIIRSLGLPGLRLTNKLLTPRSTVIKRGMDLVATTAILLMLLPLFGLLALLVRCTSSGPVFYGHTRIGRGGRRFKAWKFRTMVPDAGKRLEEYLRDHPDARQEWAATQKLTHDPRITRVGHWLRKTSLDELPQLWNVLVGEMSLVGPRPIVDEEIEKYGPVFHAYLQVRPGITGLWQVSGRNNTTYPQRIQLDAYYVRNWSPWLDFYIFFRTAQVVAQREGAR